MANNPYKVRAKTTPPESPRELYVKGKITQQQFNQALKDKPINVQKQQKAIAEQQKTGTPYQQALAKVKADEKQAERGRGRAAGAESQASGPNYAAPNFKTGGVAPKENKISLTENLGIGDSVQQTPSNVSQSSQTVQTRYKVTTQNGKERIFKDEKTAKEFVSRTTKPTPPEIPKNAIPITPNVLLYQNNKTPNVDYLLQAKTQTQSIGPQDVKGGGFGRGLSQFNLQLEEAGQSDLIKWNPVLAPPYAAVKEGAGAVAFLANTAEYLTGWMRNEDRGSDIYVPKTAIGEGIAGFIEGGSDKAKEKFSKQVTNQGGQVTTFELAQTAVGAVPLKGLSPLKATKFNLPGITLKEGSKTIPASSILVGYGSKTKPIISKVGSKISLGEPNFEKVTKVIPQPITKKQQQRGIKLAADSTKFEQGILKNPKVLSKIEGLPPKEIKKAENILSIVETGSKSKDPLKVKNIEDPIGPLTKSESKQILKSVKGQQSSVKGKLLGQSLGPYEGSASQQFFVKQKYTRPPGDLDFNLKSFGAAKARAKQTAQETGLTPKISESTKSAKVYKQDKKVAEFLNPKEKDDEGILQMIEGETLFGKKIPKNTFDTDVGKTFGLQRQFLKKGESLFSLQKTDEGLELGPAPFRKKDISDFWAIGKTKAENLRLAGKTAQASELEKGLAQLKKDFPEAEFESFFKRPDTFELPPTQKSIPDKILDSQITKDVGKTLSLNRPKEPGDSPTPKITSNSIVYRSPTRSAIRGSAVRDSAISSVSQKPSSGSSIPKSLLSNKTKPSVLSSGNRSPSPRSILNVKSPGVKSTGQQSIPTSSILTKSPSFVKSPNSPSLPKSPGSPTGLKSSSGSITSLFSGSTSPALLTKQKAIPIGIQWKTRVSKGKRKKPKNIFPFRGNVPLTELVGVYGKRDEIRYGKKKVKSFDIFDVKETRKRKKQADFNEKVRRSKSILRFN